MFWKKNKVNNTDSYPFGVNVPFETAFKALKEGYMIKDWGYNDIFYVNLNGRIFCLQDRENKHNCYEIDEFGKWGMLQNTWQILKPLSNKNTKIVKK